jgi:hypothetical protein
MTLHPLTQVDIEYRLMKLLDDLEVQTDLFDVLSERAGALEAEYKSEWAKSYLRGEGSIRQREALADVALGDTGHAYKIAEALMKAGRERLISLRTSIDALRTLNANVRAQV